MGAKANLAFSAIGSIIAFVIQVAVVPYLAIADVVAEVTLVFVIINALLNPQASATLCGFLLGLAIDLATSTPLGIRAMGYSLVAFAVSPLAQTTTLENLLARFLLIICMAFAGELLCALLMSIVGIDHDLAHTLASRVLPGGLYDSLVGLMMLPLTQAGRAGRGRGIEAGLGLGKGRGKAKALKETLPPL
jgi:rod shape-determining protein MreD